LVREPIVALQDCARHFAKHGIDGKTAAAQFPDDLQFEEWVSAPLGKAESRSLHDLPDCHGHDAITAELFLQRSKRRI
jgi:hypothetical protein